MCLVSPHYMAGHNIIFLGGGGTCPKPLDTRMLEIQSQFEVPLIKLVGTVITFLL